MWLIQIPLSALLAMRSKTSLNDFGKLRSPWEVRGRYFPQTSYGFSSYCWNGAVAERAVASATITRNGMHFSSNGVSHLLCLQADTKPTYKARQIKP